MPRLMVQLSQDEFDRLRDRALDELRHPRHTARLLLREALDLPAHDQHVPAGTPVRVLDAHHRDETERDPA